MSRGREFLIKLQEWEKKFDGDLNALARQTVQEIAVNVVRDTPVDTGFLRSSWQPSIGAEPSGSAGPGDALARIAVVVAEMKAGDVFHMMNNAEYGQHVEFGTSKMRGRFFVTTNVKRAPAIVQRLMQELQ